MAVEHITRTLVSTREVSDAMSAADELGYHVHHVEPSGKSTTFFRAFSSYRDYLRWAEKRAREVIALADSAALRRLEQSQ